MVRVFGSGQERLDGCVDYSDKKEDCNREDLDEEKIETLFSGFRLHHHTNHHPQDERSDEKEYNISHSTKIVCRIDVVA